MEIRQCARDSLFTDLFSDPEYVLQLYQGLHPEDQTTTEADIQSVNLNAIWVTGRMYNDLGFKVGERLIVLVEEQSTWSPNIAFRAVAYLMQTYMDYCLPNHRRIYQNSRLCLPKPELYVIYTGPQGRHPDSISLKSLFFDPKECDAESQVCDVDATVHVIYDRTSKGIAWEYIACCQVLEDQFRIYGRTRKAVEEAIRICQDRNILKKYLEKRKAELMNIMDHLFSQEVIDREEREEARAEGEARGESKGNLNALTKLISKNQWGLDQAMEFLEIPLDQRDYYAERLSGLNL